MRISDFAYSLSPIDVCLRLPNEGSLARLCSAPRRFGLGLSDFALVHNYFGPARGDAMDDEQQETTVGLTEAVRKKLSESQSKSGLGAAKAGDGTIPHPIDDDLAGTEVGGRYLLAEKIFEDETYVTFRAEHIFMNRRVNVKFLRAHLIDDKDALLAFKLLVQEQSTGRQSDPAGSCADFGVAEDGRPFAVYVPTGGGGNSDHESFGDTLDLAETIRREIEEAKKNQNQ